MSTQQPYIIQDFQGMNQRQDSDTLSVNVSPLLVNIDNSNPGTWRKRKGSSLVGSMNSIQDPVLGLATYYPLNSVPIPHSIRPNSVTTALINQPTGALQDMSDEAVTDKWRLAQSFEATVTGNIQLIEIYAFITEIGAGNSTDFTYEIREDSSSTPTGPLLYTDTFTATNTTVDYVSISNINVSLETGVKYWLVINAFNGNSTNGTKLVWLYSATNLYADGEGLANYPYPTNWVAFSPNNAIGDFVFRITQQFSESNLFELRSNDWALISSNAFANRAKVQSTNFLDRVYHVSESTFLSYENGGTLTEVGSGADRIKGNALAVAQNTLFVTNLDNRDRVYYSLFNIDNNVPSHQLWEDAEGSLANSTRWFTVGKPVTALKSFSVTGKCYIFTETDGFEFDISQADNAYGVVKRFGVGCANPRAITECNGRLIWMDNQGRIWAWGGAGPAIPLSWDIEDDTANESIISVINNNQIDDVCAGSIGSFFYFYVGNVTILNRDLTNVVIKGLVAQNFNYVLWSLDTYPYSITIFDKSVIDGQEVLLVGTGDGNVYQLNSGLNDGSVAVNSYWRTSFVKFGSIFDTSSVTKVYVKFRPQAEENTFLKLSYSIDRNLSFTTFSDPDEGINQYGVIDMYDVDSGNLTDKVAVVNLGGSAKGRTFALEGGNNQLNETYEISAIKIIANTITTDVGYQQ